MKSFSRRIQRLSLPSSSVLVRSFPRHTPVFFISLLSRNNDLALSLSPLLEKDRIAAHSLSPVMSKPSRHSPPYFHLPSIPRVFTSVAWPSGSPHACLSRMSLPSLPGYVCFHAQRGVHAQLGHVWPIQLIVSYVVESYTIIALTELGTARTSRSWTNLVNLWLLISR